MCWHENPYFPPHPATFPDQVTPGTGQTCTSFTLSPPQSSYEKGDIRDDVTFRRLLILKLAGDDRIQSLLTVRPDDAITRIEELVAKLVAL